MFMMFIALNAMAGPWNTAERYAETVKAMSFLHTRCRPEDCPLFIEFAASIINALNLPLGEPQSLQISWDKTSDKGPLATKYYQGNLNRFHGFTDRGEEEDHVWWCRGFQLSFVSLEMNHIGSQGVSKPKVWTRR